MWSFIKKHKWLVSGLFTITVIASILGVQLDVAPKNQGFTIGQGQLVLRIGTVEASGTVDYTCDGTDDDIQFQGALDALPANGGSIEILAGNYDVGATVTRAIDNVTIIGTGRGTYITYNGANAIFTAGGNNWTIRDLRTDAGSLNMGATTGWSWENVTINTTYYAYRTDDATTGTSWNIPTGRTVTYVIAASDALANVKAQADYVCDGTADQVEIQAAVTAIGGGATPDLGGTIKLSKGTFHFADKVSLTGYVALEGDNGATIFELDYDGRFIENNGHGHNRISGIYFDGNKAARSGGDGCILFGGSNTLIENCTFVDAEQYGIWVYSIANTFTVIKGCRFSGSGAVGIYDTGNNTSINHNIFSGIPKAIYCTGGGGSGDKAIISSNQFYNCSLIAIQVYEAHYVNIDGNWIDGNGGGGISFSKSYGSIASNNTILNTDASVGGISGGALCKGTRVMNNTIMYSLGNGIDIEGLHETVSGNYVFNCAGFGITCWNQGGGSVIVSDNTCLANGKDGIIVYDMVGCTVTGNVCQNNSWLTLGTYNGISFNSVLNSVLSNNRCFDNQPSIASLLTGTAASGQKVVSVTDGSKFFPSQMVTISDTTPQSENCQIDTISGNNLTMKVNLTQTHTVALTGVVTGRQTQGYGFQTSGTTSNNLYTSNDFSGNLTGAMVLNAPATDKSTIANNIGYIGKGEIRTVSVAITAGNEHQVTSLQNLFGGDVLIIGANLMISTAASATNPTYDMGTDDDGAGVPSVGLNLFDGVADTVGYYSALVAGSGGTLTVPILWQAVGNDWVNFIIEDANGADTAGVLYITVIGK